MSPLLIALVVGLLVAGIVVRAIPQAKGGQLLSLAGVYLYWWQTGFSDPSLGIVALLTFIVGLERASGLVGSVLTAKVAGISPWTTTIASLVGGLMFWVTNFWGFVAGLAVTAFVIEYARRQDLRESLGAAVVVVLATLAKRVAKVILATVMLLIMLAVIFL